MKRIKEWDGVCRSNEARNMDGWEMGNSILYSSYTIFGKE